jgi:hypothetical protein
MAVPGETACRPVADCGDTRWGEAPIGPDAQFVDGAYGGGASDGSEAHPWTTVQQGVDAAMAGAVVAIAAGVYAESVSIDSQAVQLWGRCPDMVQLGDDIGLTITGATGTEVHRLAVVTTSGTAVSVGNADDVVLDRLWIRGATTGLQVDDDLGPASATIRDSLVESTELDGVSVSGAALTLDRVVIHAAPEHLDTYEGVGLSVLESPTSGVPSTVELRRSLLEQGAQGNVNAEGSVVVVEDSVLRDPQQVSNLWTGSGFFGTTAAEMTIRRSVLSGHTGFGAVSTDSSLRIEHTVITGGHPTIAAVSSGAVASLAGNPEDPTTLVVVDSLLDGVIGHGVLALGGTIELDRTWVRGTHAQPDGRFGDGAVLMGSDDPAYGEIRQSRIEGSDRAGVAVFGSSLAIGDTQLECNPIQLDGEPDEGLDFTIEDLGGNECGCGDQTEVCRVVSAELEPPDPLGT